MRAPAGRPALDPDALDLRVLAAKAHSQHILDMHSSGLLSHQAVL